MSYLINHNNDSFSNSFEISGSKSESNRLLILNSIYGNLKINNLSNSDDTVILDKYITNLESHIDVHHAGTAMRFLTALLAIKTNKKFVITGSQRMKERPIKILVQALNKLGANISYFDKKGFPPLIIKGQEIFGGEISLSSNISSQYISALMLIAPILKNGLLINLEGKITSKPYLEMTLAILKKIGINCYFKNNIISIEHCSKINNSAISIESDWSSVSYFYSIVALSNAAELNIGTFYKSSIQGDVKLYEIYAKLGVETKFIKSSSRILIKKINDFIKPDHIDLDLTENPDIAQTIAVTCFGLGISCDLFGLHTLKIKETDRLEALRIELSKLGANVKVTNNSFHLAPTFSINNGISIETYNDHRMAMAFAPLALMTPIIINNPDVVTKSYKDFWKDLKSLNFNLSKI
ncbi:3-phosphoshikimate 1-carboxyvinyltransferase [Flavobacteriaceae bacterium]|nr:3-phosphoshikimate 1-carboxyvinyltransferase [Flavobacteriaceae bacterium]MDB2427263.1 3-phosphoshikimate 1-carboxyvinyltransferase [Flavobacteriaceae bacterium]MDB2567506.1 3-phosphoshikimate 1-carboxyvinyltransferase [Flavobacteriaceae bacterium]MDB2568589.1 3-phosphoshikimate 1-carboxyvinyltransferase [Flavobacteriaceae bacterium]MDB2647978.1 3-phosphoshikimate 1-carboxyvinyltransferase [Flavobacteriaceae bacterium]